MTDNVRTEYQYALSFLFWNTVILPFVAWDVRASTPWCSLVLALFLGSLWLFVRGITVLTRHAMTTKPVVLSKVK